MKSRKILPLGMMSVLIIAACGTSLYKPLSKNDSNQAKKEDAIIAMENGNFTKSSALLAEISQTEKTNEIFQLYSVSLLGKAGFDLFDLIKKALEFESNDSDKSQKSADTKDVVMNRMVESLTASTTDDNLLQVKKAIDVLSLAPIQKSKSLDYQKCLTGALYAAPYIARAVKSVTDIQTKLQALPAKLEASGSGCSANSAQIAETGAELNGLIVSAGSIGKNLAEVVSVTGACLTQGSDAQSSANQLQAKMSKLLSSADKGCVIPESQILGSYTLPSCMNTFVAGNATAVAGDGKVDGCELFINCSGGTCF